MKDLYIVAVILRPHGRRGEVVLRPSTDRINTLTGASMVYLGTDESQPVEVESIRLHKGSPLLKLKGTDDIEGALALKGEMVCLPLEDLAPLEEGEYFLHDLVGLTVLDHGGRETGTVEGFIETGGPPLMVIAGDAGREIFIPFSEGTVEEVDLKGQTITLVDLPGLVEN